MKAQQYVNFLSDHESVFSFNFGVPAKVHLPLFEMPYVYGIRLPGGRYCNHCNKRTLLHVCIWKYGYFNIVLNWNGDGNPVKKIKAEGSVSVH